MSRVRLQLADMIVSDLRGNLTPKFYESTLSVGSHACAAATPMDWSHVTLRMHASAGLYNLRWFMRGSDRIGVSSSDPAAVSISQPAASAPKFLFSIPLLLLHLSHAPNFASCSASPLSIFTSARARVCISESDDWQGEEKGEVGWQFCTKVSDEQEVVLRCSASPTAGEEPDCVRLRPIFLFLSISSCRRCHHHHHHFHHVHLDIAFTISCRRCVPSSLHRQRFTCQWPLVRNQGVCPHRSRLCRDVASRQRAHVGLCAARS